METAIKENGKYRNKQDQQSPHIALKVSLLALFVAKADDNVNTQSDDDGAEIGHRQNIDLRHVQHRDDQSDDRADSRALGRTSLPIHTADERNKAASRKEDIGAGEEVDDVIELEGKNQSKDQNDNRENRIALLECLFIDFGVDHALIDILKHNSGECDNCTVDRGHDSCDHSRNGNRADQRGKLVHNDLEEGSIIRHTVNGRTVHADNGGQESQTDAHESRDDMRGHRYLFTLCGVDALDRLLIAQSGEGNRKYHEEDCLQTDSIKSPEAARDRTGGNSRIDLGDAAATDDGDNSRDHSDRYHAHLHHAGGVSAPKAGQRGVSKDNDRDSPLRQAYRLVQTNETERSLPMICAAMLPM